MTHENSVDLVKDILAINREAQRLAFQEAAEMLAKVIREITDGGDFVIMDEEEAVVELNGLLAEFQERGRP